MGTNPKIKSILQDFYTAFIVPAHNANMLNDIRHSFTINSSDITSEDTEDASFAMPLEALSEAMNVIRKQFKQLSLCDVYVDSVDKELNDPECPYKNYLFPCCNKIPNDLNLDYIFRLQCLNYRLDLIEEFRTILFYIHLGLGIYNPDAYELSEVAKCSDALIFELDYEDDGNDLLKLLDKVKYSDFNRIGKLWESGAFGTVCLAYSPNGKLVALKKVNSIDDSYKYEKELKATLMHRKYFSSHESLITIHNIAIDFERITKDRAVPFLFYTMELADNRSLYNCFYPELNYATEMDYLPMTLSNMISQSIIPVLDLFRILLHLLKGIKALHEKGIVHRDIKPDNIIFVRGVPVLADIGLASETKNIMSLAGTPGFLPKEYFEKVAMLEMEIKTPSEALDFYALGMTAYCCCTGNEPSKFPEGMSKLFDMKEGKKLSKIINKACAHNPDDRFQTADEFIAALKD